MTKINSIIFAKRLNCLKSPLKNRNLISTRKKISSAMTIIASKTIDIRAIEAITGILNIVYSIKNCILLQIHSNTKDITKKIHIPHI